MRHVKDILRLKHQNQLSVREIARSCGLPVSTVGDYLQRAEAAGLTWPLPEGLADSAVAGQAAGRRRGPRDCAGQGASADWSEIHEQLRRKGVTLAVALAGIPPGSPRWLPIQPVLRAVSGMGRHAGSGAAPGACAGAKVVRGLGRPDGADPQRRWHDPTGVAVRGRAGGQQQDLRGGFRQRAIGLLDCGPLSCVQFLWRRDQAVVPDNPKTAVMRACRYEPQLHRTYQEMAEHYGTVDAAGPAQEAARQGQGRDRRADRRTADPGRLARPALLQRGGSTKPSVRCWTSSMPNRFKSSKARATVGLKRRKRPRCCPCRPQPFQLAIWSQAKVNIDYHVVVDNHFYSVPYQPDSPAAGGALDRPHRGVLSPGQTGGRPPAQSRAGQVHHAGGTPAQEPTSVTWNGRPVG